jgi:Large eukaryotic DNA virus major capsid protein
MVMGKYSLRYSLVLNRKIRYKRQPYQHHTRCPATGIYVYSFALNPEQHQPSGSVNMSRIDNATLLLNLTTGTASGQLRVYAINYNVLRIMAGMGGLAWTISTEHYSKFLKEFASEFIFVNLRHFQNDGKLLKSKLPPNLCKIFWGTRLIIVVNLFTNSIELPMVKMFRIEQSAAKNPFRIKVQRLNVSG